MKNRNLTVAFGHIDSRRTELELRTAGNGFYMKNKRQTRIDKRKKNKDINLVRMHRTIRYQQQLCTKFKQNNIVETRVIFEHFK